MKLPISILLVNFSAFLLTTSFPASKSHIFFVNHFFDAIALESSLSEAKYFEQDIDHTGELEGTFQQVIS